MASVKLVKACKVYDHSVTAVRDATLGIRDREFVVLVGPSGCGKSTLLRMIAGLEDVTSGDIFIGGRRVNEVPPRDRDIAMVFQNYALYPHMSVFDNMAFGLKLRKVPREEIGARVREAAAILQIEDFLDRKPKALSGGQRQRVALGRAIVRKPKVFLFDEPLSNLDAKLRVQTRIEINRLHKALRTTMIYVTHDQVEAMTMGDRIVVMKGGVIQQVGSPLECYRNPVNRFVAGFIGSPAMNFVNGTLVKGRPWRFRSDGLDLAIKTPAPRGLKPGPAVLGVRPEHLRLGSRKSGTRAASQGTVDVVEPIGNETYVYVKAGPGTLCVRLGPVDPPRPGDAVTLAADPARMLLFDAKDERRLA